MVSIAIIGALGSQATFLVRSSATANDIRVTIALKNFLYTQSAKVATEGKQQQEIDLPKGTMEYTITSLKKAPAFKDIKDLYLEQVVWKASTGNLEKKLSRLIYRPQEKGSDKKPSDTSEKTKKDAAKAGGV